jgi:hypothetical protein
MLAGRGECRCGFGATSGRDWDELDPVDEGVVLRCPECGDVYGDFGSSLDLDRTKAAFDTRTTVDRDVGNIVVEADSGVAVSLFDDASLYAPGESGDVETAVADVLGRLLKRGFLAKPTA